MNARSVRRYALAGLLFAPALAAQEGALHECLPVPGAPAIAAARAHVLDLLADHLLRLCGGDLAKAQQQLFDSASQARDPAARYALLEQAATIAEHAHAPALACDALAMRALSFAIDADQLAFELLARMREGSAPAAIAGAALRQAGHAALRADEHPQQQLQQLAQDAARASGDAWLQAMVTGQQARLRDLHAGWSRWCGGDPAPAPHQRELFGQLFLFPEQLAPVVLGELGRELPAPLDDQLASRTVADAGPERLLQLSQHASNAMVRRNLQLAARQLLADRWRAAANDDARVMVARQLASVTTLLADQDGITRLRFRTAADLPQLAIGGGEWRIDNGVLVGTSDGETNFATHRYAFATIRSLLIRGGIRSQAGQNFRLAAGDAHVIFNWEVAPENHLWIRGTRQVTAPPALVTGQEHTIALHAVAGEILVLVDDRLWFTAKGKLAGTVCVYPALGSEIFVREVLVDGELECTGPVTWPRGEPK